MALQFIFGPSGAGKSQYIYNQIIHDSLERPSENFILLVPEQYSMALQRKMVMLHPHGGTMNIDVIGFNRLSYRVFDELNVKPARVLEDFGKSMLIRQVAGQNKDALTVFGGCIDKSGFIDEVKSLMSEMYQYDISGEKLETVINALDMSGENPILLRKLQDMQVIFSAFSDRIRDSYIVAEQMTELLSQYVDQSDNIRNSTIVLDGFTGFTPIQLNLLRRIMACARDVKVVLTMDHRAYKKRILAEHELFYLTAETRRQLIRIADELHLPVKEDVFVGEKRCARWTETQDKKRELQHLERNLFRYPYEKYEGVPQEIHITEYDTPRKEVAGIAGSIRRLVMEKGYRYRDIAVICGNLEETLHYVEQIFPLYDIPFFLDYSRPVKNDPHVDAIGHVLKIVEDDFSYDSVFAFLKSGVISDLGVDETEMLENYVLARGIRGFGWWKKEFDSEVEDTRRFIMDILEPFYDSLNREQNSVREYVDAVSVLMYRLDYENHMSETAGLYDKLCDVLKKMLEIMPDDMVGTGEFHELLDLGLKDMNYGMIPNMLDMVIVGDITRTRIDEVRALYVLGVNDGVIPKRGVPAQIITDREKESLAEYDLFLAPTARINAYVEQLYLYMNMTKPKDQLFLSYAGRNSKNEGSSPSYIIGRIQNIFPDLSVAAGENGTYYAGTAKTEVSRLISGLRRLLEGDVSGQDETLQILRLYMDRENHEQIDLIWNAMHYHNIPEPLTEDVTRLLQLRLMSQSVSRLERFAGCAYSYFLQYTLGLQERNTGGIDNRDIGNILHSAMEKLFRHVHDNLDNAWDHVTEEERNSLVTNFVTQAFDEEYGEEQSENGRYAYLKGVLTRIGKRTAGSLCSIAGQNGLIPEYFEYRFCEKIPYGDHGMSMTLRGIVDRADLYYDTEHNRISLRVIDYKSGKNEFKVSELYEGLQLQLAVYTDIMLQLVEEEYNRGKTPDSFDYVSVVPEGMYYYQMRDPYINAENADEAEEKRAKELKLYGMSDKDSDVFDTVLRYAMKKTGDIAQQIADGHIEKSPIVKNGTPVCEYCIYSEVCRFDTKLGGNSYRYPRYRESDKQKIYQAISSVMGGEQDGMDRGTEESD